MASTISTTASGEAAAPADAPGTPQAGASAAIAAIAPGEAAAFGLLDRDALRDARDRLVQAVQEFASRLGSALEQAVDNASSLEVSTYVSDNMAQVTKGFDQTASLRAYTRINLDGDTTVCVPTRQAGEIDKDLWGIHLDMVRQAQANRAEMIRAAVSAVGGLLDILKGA